MCYTLADRDSVVFLAPLSTVYEKPSKLQTTQASQTNCISWRMTCLWEQMTVFKPCQPKVQVLCITPNTPRQEWSIHPETNTWNSSEAAGLSKQFSKCSLHSLHFDTSDGRKMPEQLPVLDKNNCATVFNVSPAVQKIQVRTLQHRVQLRKRQKWAFLAFKKPHRPKSGQA